MCLKDIFYDSHQSQRCLRGPPERLGATPWLSHTFPGLSSSMPVSSSTPEDQMPLLSSCVPSGLSVQVPYYLPVPSTEMPFFDICTVAISLNDNSSPMPFAIHILKCSPSPGPSLRKSEMHICLCLMCTSVSALHIGAFSGGRDATVQFFALQTLMQCLAVMRAP